VPPKYKSKHKRQQQHDAGDNPPNIVPAIRIVRGKLASSVGDGMLVGLDGQKESPFRPHIIEELYPPETTISMEYNAGREAMRTRLHTRQN
jgi:hypothetical protein